jgi:hemoglobin
MAQSVFERIGGFRVVRKIVSGFYDRVLDSPVLQPYFADIAMPRLIDHQTQFIAFVLGGPARVADETLRRAHAPLGISAGDFEVMLSLLREALEDAGELEPSDIDLVIREVRLREPLVVSKQG